MADKKAKKRKVSQPESKKQKKDSETDGAASSVAGDKENEDVRSEEKPEKEKKQKKKKNKKKNAKSDAAAQSDPTPVISVTSPKKEKCEKTPDKSKKSVAKTSEENQPKKGIDGFSAPKIRSEAAPPTPVFVRKALSKQQPIRKKEKDASKATPQEGATTATTTTPSKRLNFAMSCNKFQTVLEHSREVSYMISSRGCLVAPSDC